MIDITKKVIAVVRHIETDDITQTKKLAIASFFGYSIAKHMHTWRGIAMHTLHTCHSIVSGPLGCKRSRSEERQKRREKKSNGWKEELKLLPTWEWISTDWQGKTRNWREMK